MIKRIGEKLSEIHDRLRLWKDKAFIPIVRMSPAWLTADHVTWFRTAVIAAWFPFAVWRPAVWHVAIFLFVYFLDLLDGTLARTRNQATHVGSYFDHVSDKCNNIAMLMALYGVTGHRFGYLVFFVWWDVATSLWLIAEGSHSKCLPSPFIRPPLEFCVKTALWALLLFHLIPFLVTGA